MSDVSTSFLILSWRGMWKHPAHALALGFGSGLSKWAPGTAGTLLAWLLFALINMALEKLLPSPDAVEQAWLMVLLLGFPIGVWACTVTARALQVPDPSAVVWDEIWAFWLVLLLIWPTSWVMQLLAFALFRVFDAVKKGPVGWADARFKLQAGQSIGWRQGFGIMFDDVVAAGLTMLVLTLFALIVGRV